MKSSKPKAKARIGANVRSRLSKPSGRSRADAVLERFRAAAQRRGREGVI